jgi:hypothetical protein
MLSDKRSTGDGRTLASPGLRSPSRERPREKADAGQRSAGSLDVVMGVGASPVWAT